jgi:hypothetical protein
MTLPLPGKTADVEFRNAQCSNCAGIGEHVPLFIVRPKNRHASLDNVGNRGS